MTNIPSSSSRSTTKLQASRTKRLQRFFSKTRLLLRSIHPAWFICIILLSYIIISTNRNSHFLPIDHFDRPIDAEEQITALEAARLFDDSEARARNRAHAALNHVNQSTVKLGNHFCVLQPTISSGKSSWAEKDARNHIALRAFMRTFATSVTKQEQQSFKFSIYYGHDSDDPVFGDLKLRTVFADEARTILKRNGFDDDVVKLVFTPLYGLHGRINAIWNVLAKDAYYDGCDYFFLSNDDMVFFTSGWVTASHQSLNGIGSPTGHKRPCRYFGIVRFKDEWANWATFTFHVSTRTHLEIFDGIYYPVPYNSAHNDYWINFVYRHFDASKFRGEVKVRNRVDDVDYALAHPKDKSKIAPPRYLYDKRGNARKYILEGRARVQAWLDKYKHTSRCPPPL